MDLKANILIIDDEPGIRVACQRVLEPVGYHVELAASIQEGIEKISSGSYDLVLLDVMMPDGRGLDLLDPIHMKDPETVCIIITGYATVELAVEAIKHGAYDFIAKPFTSDLLIMTVNQGLEKRRLSLETKRLQAVEQEALDLARDKDEMERLDQFKSEFMLTVAHELRSPVGGAQSLLRTLARGLAGNLNQQQRDILKRVEGRLDILLELIDDLLTLAAGKTADLEKPLIQVALQPILQAVIERFSVEAGEKDISLDYHPNDNDLVVLASEDGIEKIIVNLIGNAIKYTPTNGKVQIHLERDGNNAVLTISDTGIGIPEKDLARVGEEFFRAGNARRSGVAGTGLGLSIVMDYLDIFGGEMAVESSVGQGSSFKIRLPLTKGVPL
jgi:signal transduction histidine kinase